MESWGLVESSRDSRPRAIGLVEFLPCLCCNSEFIHGLCIKYTTHGRRKRGRHIDQLNSDIGLWTEEIKNMMEDREKFKKLMKDAQVHSKLFDSLEKIWKVFS